MVRPVKFSLADCLTSKLLQQASWLSLGERGCEEWQDTPGTETIASVAAGVAESMVRH